jgi:predicted nucleic acid-binding protein
MSSTCASRSTKLEREDVADRMRSIIEVDRVDFAEAYLAACAEASGVGAVASFDRTLDRVPTVRRIEPGG